MLPLSAPKNEVTDNGWLSYFIIVDTLMFCTKPCNQNKALILHLLQKPGPCSYVHSTLSANWNCFYGWLACSSFLNSSWNSISWRTSAWSSSTCRGLHRHPTTKRWLFRKGNPYFLFYVESFYSHIFNFDMLVTSNPLTVLKFRLYFAFIWNL